MSLEDIEAIKQLKARYFRFMDTKQWDKWRQNFTDDCQFAGASKSYANPDEYVAVTRERLQDAVTTHQGHMPEIVLTDDRTARGVWTMFDWVEFPDERDIGFGVNRGFMGYGIYEEEYRKENGAWKIAFLQLTRLKLSILTDPPPSIDSFWVSSRGRDWLEGYQTTR
jgi:hypothetical protein